MYKLDKYLEKVIAFVPRFVSEEVRQKRLDTCENCEKLIYGSLQRCGECGCPIIGKVAVEQFKCPIGKW